MITFNEPGGNAIAIHNNNNTASAGHSGPNPLHNNNTLWALTHYTTTTTDWALTHYTTRWGTVAQLLALLALPPHSKKVMGSIPAWAAVGSVGQVLPRVHSAQVGYLPGLSVGSLHVLPVFTRGFLH